MIFTILFFFSGAAGLIYEVLWMRKLSLFFGSDIYSSSITLSVFMGGLALGGYIASYFVDRIKYQIAYYAILEILIGIYAVFFGKLLVFFDPFIALVYKESFVSFPIFYQLGRIAIAIILLVIPTTMMGSTLPIILKALTPKATKFGKVAGHFYAINTFGALGGVFVSGFILLPRLGLNTTNLIAVSINVFVGLACLAIFVFKDIRPVPFSDIQTALHERLNALKETSRFSDTNSDWKSAAFFAIAVSGFGGLALEVIWTRMLIRSFSATVYSFSMMLVGFLLGIAFGSKLIAPYIDSSEKAVKLLAKIEIILGLSVAVLAALSFFIPSVFGILVWGLTALSPKLFGFASIFGALLISIIFILPSTMLLGAAFPAALKTYNVDFMLTGRNSGRIVFVNTVGCMVGSLAAGFIFIPTLGSRNSMLLLSLIFFANGLYVQYCISKKSFLDSKRLIRTGFILGGLFFINILIPNQTVLNYNLQKNAHPNVIYHSEGLSGVVDVIKNPNGTLILSIDGNIEADTSLQQRRHFALKAHLPLMLSSDKSKEVLIVGLGLGITTASILKHPDIKRVDIVELLPAVIKAQKYLKDVNCDVLSDSRINIRIDDGRNFLKVTDNKYDVITADPIHPRISGVGVLYTKEYYELIFKRLKDNGALLQWMPLYSISAESFEVALKTMAEVFPNTSVWYVPGHMLFLGTKQKKPIFDYETLRTKFMDKNIASDLKSIGIDNELTLLQLQIMSPEKLRLFIEERPSKRNILNTEDLPYLEYNTPAEFLMTPEANLKVLLPYGGADDTLVTNAPPEFLERLKAAQSSYIAAISK